MRQRGLHAQRYHEAPESHRLVHWTLVEAIGRLCRHQTVGAGAGSWECVVFPPRIVLLGSLSHLSIFLSFKQLKPRVIICNTSEGSPKPRGGLCPLSRGGDGRCGCRSCTKPRRCWVGGREIWGRWKEVLDAAKQILIQEAPPPPFFYSLQRDIGCGTREVCDIGSFGR
ncbi:hypothetical protein B0T25DRAFT_549214 [Lasiosphaeria hispida]|uniref:Uncharacterized protein n=1 Tax=Lasiosphaeria hispida TaxID=260671 RepID=A0AAJ0MCR9_9PEZI|nr:hypothetical protein B0T25DRAFT_549214 [Lasiosphaeria hispida]